MLKIIKCNKLAQIIFLFYLPILSFLKYLSHKFFQHKVCVKIKLWLNIYKEEPIKHAIISDNSASHIDFFSKVRTEPFLVLLAYHTNHLFSFI